MSDFSVSENRYDRFVADPTFWRPKNGIHFRIREREIHPPPTIVVGRERWADMPGYSRVYFDTQYPVWPRPTWDVARFERCLDEIHPGPPFRSGGPLRLLKATSPWYDVQGSVNVNDGPFGLMREYVGGFVPTSFGTSGLSDLDIQNMGFSGPYGPAYQDPSDWGATAYNRYKPKTSDMDLPVFLWELKDLPGMVKTSSQGFHDIWKSAGGKGFGWRQAPKKASDHFLNHVFGWSPFLSDALKIADTWQNSQLHLMQLADTNGQWRRTGGTVHREDEIIEQSDNGDASGPFMYPIPSAGQLLEFRPNPRTGKYQCGTTYFTTRKVREVRFMGNFRFYLPTLEPEKSSGLYDPNRYKSDRNKLNHVINMLRLYGVKVNPTLLWKITPWSFLTDFFLNTGKVIDNISAGLFDGVVAKYAYLTDHTVLQVVNSSTLFLHDYSRGSVDTKCVWYQELDQKRRDEASPFGFGLAPGEMSPMQQLICLALGISQGSK